MKRTDENGFTPLVGGPMYRKAMTYLEEWGKDEERKPLIVRGARQVGKTYLVRAYAEKNFANLVEINFDLTPEKAEYFKAADIDEIIQLLEADSNQRIESGKTLLFLDEIQAAPEVLHKLRYFYEKKPRLHVIAAGSLLDFLLKETKFSMPVGRVEYMHLAPMDFEEYLLAIGENRLYDLLRSFELGKELPAPLHQKLMKFLQWFFVVGGMPGAVKQYMLNHEIERVQREHHSIIQSYIDDLNKYAGQYNPIMLQTIFKKIPSLLAEKIKYVNIILGERTTAVAACLGLLELAGVSYRIYHTAANGIPLGAEKKERDFKLLFLDVGMASTILGVRLNEIYLAKDPMTVNKGVLSEQFIGQHLLHARKPFIAPELYFWNRQKKNSTAEVDYIHSIGQNVIPVEVKSGKTGTLKSLHQFLMEKKLNFAVRFNADVPSVGNFTLTLPQGGELEYRLVSLPLYMVGQLNRILLEQELAQ